MAIPIKPVSASSPSQTGLSHACGNGFLPILELLCEVEECDINLPDKEGNTPLIFAAQAGQYASVCFNGVPASLLMAV